MGVITGLTRDKKEWIPQFVKSIDRDICIGCGRCYKVCPRDVFELVERDEDEMDEDLDELLAKLNRYREEEGTTDKDFQIHVISIDGFTVDGVKRLEDKGVTDVIVGFRVPYVEGPDTEPLDSKIRNLEWFAENVIAKV